MKKSIIALAAGTVLLGALSVPSLGFAEQTKTSANISSERSYTPKENAKMVRGIRGATVKESMKWMVPTSIFYRQGDYAGDIYLHKWIKKGKDEVYPIYQGLIYRK
ncbi:hypothetical protein C1I60_22590 [Paenibacillus terrae]|uniref:Uncharacterized protein n=1 Tax=Paenibacillus terrae TaxID=159743 RepID=A0A4U2PRY4_9BACL|nr:hypothetical protein [Paenibacillus terrae]TKH42087.1 hypothetical protein C1I60_22590 [Paenibacillus terrae]